MKKYGLVAALPSKHYGGDTCSGDRSIPRRRGHGFSLGCRRSEITLLIVAPTDLQRSPNRSAQQRTSVQVDGCFWNPHNRCQGLGLEKHDKTESRFEGPNVPKSDAHRISTELLHQCKFKRHFTPRLDQLFNLF